MKLDSFDIRVLMAVCEMTELAFCTLGNHWAVSIPFGHNCPECFNGPRWGARICLS